jgi:hypothetical protein
MIGRRTLTLATALVLGIGLIMALPILGRQAARAASQAESGAGMQQTPYPALADRLFRVDWSAGAAGQGQSRIVGYVYNDYREDAVNVQLRINALDPSGQAVASIDQAVGDTVPAGGRVFFDARVPGIGSSYRVAVASFDFMADGQWKTLTTEQLLAGAGFQKKVADTPEKLAHLGTLTPARRLVAHRRDGGQLYYVYADPAMCKCLYVGTPAQNQRVLEKRLAIEQLVAQQELLNEDAVIWALWAPWPGF